MKLAAGTPGELRRLPVQLDPLIGKHHGFMDNDVRIFGILQEPFVGHGIATENYFHPGVL